MMNFLNHQVLYLDIEKQNRFEDYEIENIRVDEMNMIILFKQNVL